MNDKVQEKIVDRVNELVSFEKDMQKGLISKGLEVREVIGLVAYATQNLVQWLIIIYYKLHFISKFYSN